MSLLDELTEDLRIAVAEADRRTRVAIDAVLDRNEADKLVEDLKTAIAALEPQDAGEGDFDLRETPEDVALSLGASAEEAAAILVRAEATLRAAFEAEQGQPDGSSPDEDAVIDNLLGLLLLDGPGCLPPEDCNPLLTRGLVFLRGGGDESTITHLNAFGIDYATKRWPNITPNPAWSADPAKPAPVNSTEAATETVEGEQTEPARVVIDDQLADPELEPFADEPEAEAEVVTEEPEEEAPTQPATGWSSYWAKKPEPVS